MNGISYLKLHGAKQVGSVLLCTATVVFGTEGTDQDLQREEVKAQHYLASAVLHYTWTDTFGLFSIVKVTLVDKTLLRTSIMDPI